jgi:hypothetical protein
VNRLLRACVVEPLDEARARRAGVLCADRGQSDVTDAVVVSSVTLRGDDIVTSELDDLTLLCEVAEATGRLIPALTDV